MNVRGYKFGNHWCEIHVDRLGDAHVARMFVVDPPHRKMRRLTQEITRPTQMDSFAAACAYLTARFGIQRDFSDAGRPPTRPRASRDAPE